jgi:rhodanese-related sulfurtransferase
VTGRVAAAALAAMLEDGGELALLDVREEGVFAKGHLLLAASVPLSRLELKLARLVPRRSARIVLCDADDGLAERAAAKLHEFGYRNVSVLAGGVAAWRALGRELFAGVYVPSKAFGEHVEHHDGTPSISAEELAAKRAAGEKMVVLDSRPLTEFQRMSLPGAVDCPGAELVHRIFEVAPDPDTLVVVNCAGRTRSIIGAQSLRNADVPHRVVALRNGTMDWTLAGLELEHGKREMAPPPRPAALEKARAARGASPRGSACATRPTPRCAAGETTRTARCMCSMSARRRNISAATCRRPRARPAASSCSRPTPTSAPAMRASCSSIPTACAPR